MRGTGQSGTFQGHAIPAAFFFGFGLFILLLTLLRARRLPPGANFAEIHVPEKNVLLMKTLSYIIIVCTALGFIYEGIGGYICCSSFFFELPHQTLYTSFFFVGCVTQLESRGRLPPDYSRRALSLALFLEYVLWYDHAIMKKDGTDQRVHIIMAQICLAGSAVFAFSVYRPENVLAYVGGWAMLILQSFWLITAGINAGFYAIPRHSIGVLVCLEILAVASMILIGATCCGSVAVEVKDGADQVIGGARPRRREYESLGINGADEDDDEAAPAMA